MWTTGMGLAKDEGKWRIPSLQPHKGYTPEKGLAVYLSELEAGYPYTAAGLAKPVRYEALGNRGKSSSVAGISHK